MTSTMPGAPASTAVRSQARGPCEHLRQAPADIAPLTPEGCGECLEQGAQWSRLRLCLTCGHVGCCDESTGQHASEHARETGHPVVRSFEPGEKWTWCFVDHMSAGHGDHALGVERLRQTELFQGLSEQDLDALVAAARTAFVPQGQTLFSQGDPGDALYLVLDGELEVTARRPDGTVVPLAVRGVGEFIGEMSLLEGAPRSGTVRALRDSHLLMIDEAAFFSLLAHSPSATRAVLRVETSRLHSTMDQLQAQKKLALLGELSAGLIHDLNNPSGAIQRSSALLRDAVNALERAAFALSVQGIGADKLAEVQALSSEPGVDGSRPVDPLAVAEQEGAIEDWLSQYGLEQPWEIASSLLEHGWDATRLARLQSLVGEDGVAGVVRWLAARGAVTALLDEMGTGAKAISEVVRAVKDYSYLDQAPVQDVNLTRSIDNVLVLLKHKIGPNMRVTRDYAQDLPTVEAYGSQLGQVWMNLIDNALDALNGSGEIRIRTAREGTDEVLVEICDDGPGIPPEVQARIFEPFFTTKPQGVGSGQGLHTVRTVVENRHHGKIDMRSHPGETCFTVRLPLRMAKA